MQARITKSVHSPRSLCFAR